MPNFSTFLPLNALPDRYIGRLRRWTGKTIYKPCHDQKKAIFIHVPKAAGTSISLTLFGEEVGHYSSEMYKSVDPHKFHQYFKFSFVRDPVSRFVSSYNYLKNGGNTQADKYFSRTYMCKYPDMISLLKKLSQEKERFGIFKIINWGHFIPQVNFLCDSTGIQVDYVGKVENIDIDFSFVSQKINNTSVSLQKLNSSPAFGKEFISDEVKRVIWNVYRDDYETFHYDKPI